MKSVCESIFGNRSATYALLYLQHYGKGHASLIAKTFDVSAMGIQRQLYRLENSGVLSSHLVGKARVFTFNDAEPTVKSLRTFLQSELARTPQMFTLGAVEQ